MSNENRQDDDISTSRNDVSSEPSPGPEENDNLGAEDGKGEPPTVPPTGSGDDSDDGDVDAEAPGAGS
ncbi:hypothetical protein [Microbacterium sp. W4I20]|uniref:hypothetical protein n=1 Tax=Microbacterium sp. W4I20 TaxID=3042262 RepID=UPI00277EF1E1|nr:hypothetical protein [Microbacterium sp. W4I20]MDQ0727113.1 hypothetical protein [Microbacterium sp. W4I20]